MTTGPSPVRQLRLVVRADDYDAALTFFRDVLGMPQREAFSAEGGAEVTILEAGVATLEIANRAQVEFIDRVETDGRHDSPALRVAFEVGDAAGVTARLVDGGAELIASPRVTPWNSLNARLAAPAGVEITVFQELGPETGLDPT
jgi:predicted enzyme related to lactoylglutathione lyase